jgi:hypothetical protein
MHLSDDQLAEIERYQQTIHDKQRADCTPPQTLVHFEACEACQEQLQNLAAFRLRLAQDSTASIPAFQWQAIEREIAVSKEHKGLYLLNRKVKRLQLAFVAVAASFLLLLVYPYIAGQTQNAVMQNAVMQNAATQNAATQNAATQNAATQNAATLQLAAIIEENYQLQKELALTAPQSFAQKIAFTATEIQLQEIDSRLQLFYLDRVSVEQKISLWNERKQLIMALLDNKPKPNVLVI